MPRKKRLNVQQRSEPAFYIESEVRPVSCKEFNLCEGDKVVVGKDLRPWIVSRVSDRVFSIRNAKGIVGSYQKKEYAFGLVDVRKV